jgi:hypothetical protein
MESFISNIPGGVGILFAWYLYLKQLDQSRNDKDSILSAIESYSFELKELKTILEELLKGRLEKSENNIPEKSILMSAKTSLDINENESVKVFIHEIMNEDRIIVEKIIKGSLPISITSHLSNLAKDYQFFINDTMIYKCKRSLNEMGIMTPKKFGNKKVCMHLAHTDNHFTEIKNNALKIIEPFEDKWMPSFKVFYLTGLMGSFLFKSITVIHIVKRKYQNYQEVNIQKKSLACQISKMPKLK